MVSCINYDLVYNSIKFKNCQSRVAISQLRKASLGRGLRTSGHKTIQRLQKKPSRIYVTFFINLVLPSLYDSDYNLQCFSLKFKLKEVVLVLLQWNRVSLSLYWKQLNIRLIKLNIIINHPLKLNKIFYLLCFFLFWLVSISLTNQLHLNEIILKDVTCVFYCLHTHRQSQAERQTYKNTLALIIIIKKYSN